MPSAAFDQRNEQLLQELADSGQRKPFYTLTGPMGPVVNIEGKGEVLVLCSNNYLGLADNPEVIEAGLQGLKDYGAGTASVRFICGTLACHRSLEAQIAEFIGTPASLSYVSCWNANEALFPTMSAPGDMLLSDELNHASIIDGVRLCKAQRYRYRNSDMQDLEQQLQRASDARFRLIATDGVFSMDGYIANLPAICDLADRYNALVMVDDSHSVGFLGPRGRGTHEHHDVMDRIDILTGTLGKALGGASGGYTSGRKEIIELLRQRSRPYLFSNSVAPPIVAASLKAIELLTESTELRDRLEENTRFFRQQISSLGFDVLPGEHPIVPIMLGDAERAVRMADALLEKGIYVIGFSYPVVPKGRARIRVQVSAAHTREDLQMALDSFVQVRADLAEPTP